MVAQMAVVPRKVRRTATTSTAGTPKRFKQLAAGCARPHNCFAVLGEGRRKSRPESRIHNWVGNDFCSRALAVR